MEITRTFAPSPVLCCILLPPIDKRRRVMESLLLIFAWGAGIMSLFLVADMIAGDLAIRRAERIARRRSEASPEHRHRASGSH
jgi:hypothetical protein